MSDDEGNSIEEHIGRQVESYVSDQFERYVRENAGERSCHNCANWQASGGAVVCTVKHMNPEWDDNGNCDTWSEQ